MYAKRVAAETETEETPLYPQEKDRKKQTMSKSKSETGMKKRKYENMNNARQTTRQYKTHNSDSQGARGGGM